MEVIKLVQDNKVEEKDEETTEEKIEHTLSIDSGNLKVSTVYSECNNQKHLIGLSFDQKTPYSKALAEVLTNAINIRENRVKTRGPNYEEVWQAMKPSWIVGIICTKALRMDDAVTNNLIAEIDENILDIFNYLIFLWSQVRQDG